MYRAMALMFLGIFYGIYIIKMIKQKIKGIETDQMAKGKEGHLFRVELLLKIATYSVVLVEIISILMTQSMFGLVFKLFGVIFCTVGDCIFFLAVYTMRDSWRAGIPSEYESAIMNEPEIKIIKTGIYKYSRNPAFLGFDLVYIGILLMYFNPVLLIFTLFAMIMLHLQILEEEKFLPTIFGKEYVDYKKETKRYLGYGKLTWDKLRRFFYICLGLFSIVYYGICLLYVGFALSLGWVWVLIALFSVLRIYMLTKVINGKRKIPKWLSVVYQGIALFCIVLFLIGESLVIFNANSPAPDDLDYVIVLGAGLNGSRPSRPLQQRINTAYEYSMNHPDAILILSGGQGPDEAISEAECMRRELLSMGIPEERLIKEERSTSTEENIRYSYLILKDRGDEGAKIGVLTNSFHIYRARLQASLQDHYVYGVPALTLFPIGIHYTVREFFGLLFIVVTNGWL